MKGRYSLRNILTYTITLCLVINGITLPFFLYYRPAQHNLPPFHTQLSFSAVKSISDESLHDTSDYDIFEEIINTNNLFRNYDPNNPPLFYLKNDTKEYVKKIGDLKCLIDGTNWTITNKNSSVCQCKDDWFGPHCSWPFLLQFSTFTDFKSIKLRENPRRVINMMSFNIEVDLLDIRLGEMGDITDAFMITESNFTGHGDSKPMYLLDALRKGFFLKHHKKIIHVFQDYFPEEARNNGWLADFLPRDVIGSKGIPKQLRHGKADDIFILTDADEILMKEVVIFLKLHDGYPEPVCMNLHKTNYGFYWRVGNGDWMMCGAATLGFMSEVMHNKISWLRNPMDHIATLTEGELDNYTNKGGYVMRWELCPSGIFCGWHCSWCFHIEGIQRKLLSAINADFPRWGDYPEKTDLSYIRNLVKNGVWFNGEEKFYPIDRTFEMYAPYYTYANEEKFKYLLDNPYRNMSKLLKNKTSKMFA